MTSRYALSTIIIATSVFLTGTAIAAKAETDRLALEDAKTVVLEALEAEAAGDVDTRELLLQKVSESSDFAPAKWQSGGVMKPEGGWSTVDESVMSAKKNQILKAYRKLRASLPDTADSHFSIAKWCFANALPDQSRAHLHRVLDYAPDHAITREALGYQKVGEEWMSPTDIAEVAARTNYAKQSVQTFGAQLTKIVRELKSPHNRTRTKAKEELMALTDPDAVPAVELALSSPGVEPSQLAIDWISRVDTLEASQALARYSLLHPNDGVRDYAIAKLKDRPFHDFVPDMLEMLTARVDSMIVPSFDRNGQFNGYRQAFAKKKFESVDILVMDRRFERLSTQFNPDEIFGAIDLPDGVRQNVARAVDQRIEMEARVRAEAEVAARQRQVQRENSEQLARNQKIGYLIAHVSNRPETSDAEKMWNWWDEYNETGYQEYKPERYRSVASVEYIPDFVPPVSGECFVSGTQVMTQLGSRDIESIVPGDIVLSRNVTSGALNWKPVLQATQRPPAETVNILVGSETLCCTNGHLFWVSGKGWIKASKLRKGDVLHAAAKPQVVENVTESAKMQTYNLRVADNANYFVGANRLLTHDVTARTPNHQTVPGMAMLQRMEKQRK